MEAVILCGIQASGKSTFCRERFTETHVRLNLDMLRTRHREGVLLAACLEAKQSFVIDNTNPTRAERAKYIEAARAAGFRVVGYYFSARLAEALERNAARPDAVRVPDAGVKATSAKLELPTREEGFDQLYFVRAGPGGFAVEEWRDEV
jgi:predicted kinase